jgi:signal transduction histidine kinase
MLPHIFDRFARNEHSNLCGTGLDLPIVKELVEQMGGQIEIQSDFGKGTTCYVMIPCELISREKKTEMNN